MLEAYEPCNTNCISILYSRKNVVLKEHILKGNDEMLKAIINCSYFICENVRAFIVLYEEDFYSEKNIWDFISSTAILVRNGAYLKTHIKFLFSAVKYCVKDKAHTCLFLSFSFYFVMLPIYLLFLFLCLGIVFYLKYTRINDKN